MERAFSSHLLNTGSLPRCTVSDENLRSGLQGVKDASGKERQARPTSFRHFEDIRESFEFHTALEK